MNFIYILTFGVCGAVRKSSGGFHAQTSFKPVIVVESYLIVVVTGGGGWRVVIIINSLIAFVLKIFSFK